jgi:hypothetical protein
MNLSTTNKWMHKISFVMEDLVVEHEDNDQESFANVLESLQNPAASKRRDPRSLRLAAVTSAVLDIVRVEGPSDHVASEASQVYAKAITALEGTLTAKQNEAQDLVNTLATQSAILELVHATIPHVVNKRILAATLPLTSRILRAIVSVCTNHHAHHQHDSTDEVGGVNALLRWVCRVANGLLSVLPASTDLKTVQQFFIGTLLELFHDKRPKVRKAAHASILELLAAPVAAPNRGPKSTIVKEMNSYIHKTLLAAVSSNDRLDDKSYQELLHLLPFLERSILCLDYSKLGSDLMEFLSSLLQFHSSTSSDFHSVSKVKENSPKIMAIGGLLSVVLVMLQDDSAERSLPMNEFAPRVLASLLQVKLQTIFASGTAESEILIRTKTLYGQVMLAAGSRILDCNSELATKLFPLAVQSVVQLSRPDNDDNPLDDSTAVANALLVELTQVIRTKASSLSDVASGEAKTKCLQNLLQSVRQCMDSSYQEVWALALRTLAILIQHIHHMIDVQPTVDSLIELHDSVPRTAQKAVEGAVADLIQGVGLEDFWHWVSWQTPNSKSQGTYRT